MVGLAFDHAAQDQDLALAQLAGIPGFGGEVLPANAACGLVKKREI